MITVSSTANNPYQWWQNQRQRNEISQIKQSQAVQREELEFRKQKYDDILKMYSKAFGEFGEGNDIAIPSQFGEMVNLYQPGGQFGEGGKAEVAKAGQQALAAGQVSLTGTGMSSGTNVAGLAARVSADTGLANKKIEDERVALLGGALGQAGSAQLTAEQLKAQREAALLSSLSSFGRV